MRQNNGKPVPMIKAGESTADALEKLPVIIPETVNPVDYCILVRIAAEADISAGGILKPVEHMEKTLMGKTEAVLIAAGSLAFTDARGDYSQDAPEIGDEIVLTKYPGNTYRDENNNLYRFCSDKDVLAIIKEKSE